MMRLILLLMITSLLRAQHYSVVDVDQVRAEGDSRLAIQSVNVPAQPREIACDILVAGAGMGGVAAAMRAAARGHSVCLTEETNWIGGQLTSGGVPALDENRFIEISGGTRTYYQMRQRIRDYYRTHFQLASDAMENFNPGACYVSALCFEPKAGVAVLQEMMKTYSIQTFLRTRVLDVDVVRGRIESVLAYRFDQREVIRFKPKFVLDATEQGDLLPLAHVPYVVGSEPKSETGEPHASAAANNACVQSFTYPFAVEHRAGEQHRIPKPDQYEYFRDSQPFSLKVNYPKENGWKGEVQYTMFGEDAPVPNNMSPRPFFAWRRLLAAKNFTGENAPRDLALINWPKQDYHSESLLDRTPLDTARILQQAKRLSLAFLYWMQNDLPRDDGKGNGYPELMLRKDVMDTRDGLSKVPYIRESRRIRGQARVAEQDIVFQNDQPRARWFPDSIGTGFYMVDIHPCGAGEHGQMMMPKPFQVPMGALVPQGVSNFLAAGKNIGVTHLTNGAFRLHPIEWNVGEAAAVMASLSLQHGVPAEPADVQRELVRAGVPLVWFDDLSVDHPAFAAIQIAAIRGEYPVGDGDLHASPDAPLTRGQAAVTLAARFGFRVSKAEAIAMALKEGWMAADHRNWFHADLPFYWTDWREDRFPSKLPAFRMLRTGPVRRGEMALRLW